MDREIAVDWSVYRRKIKVADPTFARKRLRRFSDFLTIYGLVLNVLSLDTVMNENAILTVEITNEDKKVGIKGWPGHMYGGLILYDRFQISHKHTVEWNR